MEYQLVEKNLAKGETTKVFITRIKDLQNQMTSVGIQKISEELAWRCLYIFPPNFDGLITKLNTQVRPQPFPFEEP